MATMTTEEAKKWVLDRIAELEKNPKFDKLKNADVCLCTIGVIVFA